MLLIIEIALTISAWKKGWRGRALLPLGVAGAIALIIGGAMGASGATTQDVMANSLAFVPLDLAAIAALIVMNAKGRKAAEHSAAVADTTLATQ